MKDKWYAFHWKNSGTTYHKGTFPAQAAKNAGYGAGVLRALDRTEEAKFLPLEFKEIIFIQEGKRSIIPPDGLFRKELFKSLDTVSPGFKYKELTISMTGNEYLIGLEIKNFCIICVVMSIIKPNGDVVNYKVDDEYGRFGFKYDFDSQIWRVVGRTSGQPTFGEFSNWREAEISCTQYNDPSEYMTHVCIDCQDAFVISLQEKYWFTSNNLSVPKRCQECRERKRDEKDIEKLIDIGERGVERGTEVTQHLVGLMQEAVDNYSEKYGERWRYLLRAKKYLRIWNEQIA